MKIKSVALDRCQVGWRCTVWFEVETSRQFTDEIHDVCEAASWWPAAIWRGLRAANRLAAELRAKPGEREAKGWN